MSARVTGPTGVVHMVIWGAGKSAGSLRSRPPPDHLGVQHVLERVAPPNDLAVGESSHITYILIFRILRKSIALPAAGSSNPISTRRPAGPFGLSRNDWTFAPDLDQMTYADRKSRLPRRPLGNRAFEYARPRQDPLGPTPQSQTFPSRR